VIFDEGYDETVWLFYDGEKEEEEEVLV